MLVNVVLDGINNDVLPNVIVEGAVGKIGNVSTRRRPAGRSLIFELNPTLRSSWMISRDIWGCLLVSQEEEVEVKTVKQANLMVITTIYTVYCNKITVFSCLCRMLWRRIIYWLNRHHHRHRFVSRKRAIRSQMLIRLAWTHCSMNYMAKRWLRQVSVVFGFIVFGCIALVDISEFWSLVLMVF